MKRRKKRCYKMVLLGSLAFLLSMSAFAMKLAGDMMQADPNDKNDKKQQEEERGNIPQGDDLYQRFARLASQNRRYQPIIKQYSKYPKELLELLIKNQELLDFVLAYPEKKGQVLADDIGPIIDGEIPHLYQWDIRWGYGTYGDHMLAITGCAPTCLSMVITALTKDTSITPYVVAQYAQSEGYYVPGTGTSWSLISEGSAHFHVQAQELSLSKESIWNALSSGQPIICSLRPGDFTTTGHFIVLTGLQDGKITVNDPNSKQRSNQLWSYETLEPQIENLWSFSL